MADKVYVGNRVGSLEVGEPYKPVSRVTLRVDDDHSYTAGDDTGLALEYDMPWATQEMVDSIYKNLKGFVYRPFKATDAMIDPAAELGDGVTINGQYFMLAQMTTRFDAKGASDIGAPSTGEIDHEYPRLDPLERELKRRVKLGQSYYGTKITRKDGLVIEKTDGENVTARVVMNADELAFYTVGDRVLYFDPTTGTYKFTGELNVNDNFIVDKLGNVTMKGGINLSDGSITWGGQGPVKYQFSADETNWHDTMQPNDKYRRDSLDGGTTWGDAYQFKGQDGQNGRPGSDADVTFANILLALQKAASVQSTFITADEVGAPNIYGGNIYGANIYAGDGSGSFAKMDEEGFKVYVNGISEPKIQLVKYAPTGDAIQLILGAGTGVGGRGKLFLTKIAGGAEINYVSAAGETGFRFHDDGTITIKGALEGVHATFA